MSAIISGLLAFLGSIFGVKKQSETEKEILEKEIKTQFRLAAISERLEKHQEAYILCSEMFFNIHSEEINDSVNKADEWWVNNCLYLDDKSRKAFKEAILQAPLFHKMDKGDDKARKIFDQVEEARNHIIEGVKLTPLEDKEGSVKEDSIKEK